tara:strand:+ start:4664 stop:5041 length:378 start_codon:yes stop_codon:yes gene_type:complete
MLKKLIFILFFIFIISCSKTPVAETGPLDDFAKCLKNNGAKMYGSYTCSVCKKQRELFGPSFHHVGEIECHPRGENPQTQLCLEKDIKKTPTWTLEKDGVELDRKEGYQTIEILSEFSGCTLQNG